MTPLLFPCDATLFFWDFNDVNNHMYNDTITCIMTPPERVIHPSFDEELNFIYIFYTLRFDFSNPSCV